MSETQTTAPRTRHPELTLLAALRAIVQELRPAKPGDCISTESYLPGELIDNAQAALAVYGADVRPIAQSMAVAA